MMNVCVWWFNGKLADGGVSVKEKWKVRMEVKVEYGVRRKNDGERIWWIDESKQQVDCWDVGNGNHTGRKPVTHHHTFAQIPIYDLENTWAGVRLGENRKDTTMLNHSNNNDPIHQTTSLQFFRLQLLWDTTTVKGTGLVLVMEDRGEGERNSNGWSVCSRLLWEWLQSSFKLPHCQEILTETLPGSFLWVKCAWPWCQHPDVIADMISYRVSTVDQLIHRPWTLWTLPPVGS